VRLPGQEASHKTPCDIETFHASRNAVMYIYMYIYIYIYILMMLQTKLTVSRCTVGVCLVGGSAFAW